MPAGPTEGAGSPMAQVICRGVTEVTVHCRGEGTQVSRRVTLRWQEESPRGRLCAHKQDICRARNGPQAPSRIHITREASSLCLRRF